MPTTTETSPGDPLDIVIASYLQQIEAGDVPDRAELLAEHPDLADRLRAFFADFDRLDRQAAELRLSADPNLTADHSAPPAELPRVRYFGDYELLEVIAQGGMGIVYKARQVSLNRVVGLKMILKGELATPRDLARFRAEAEAAANLDHPNIVPIYEVGEYEGQQYYAMRFIEGSSLARLARGEARAEARRLACIVRAVHYAHQRGILHRDLKPSNILIDTTGTPFVADFGLAKRVNGDRSLTESGAIVGTPRYMALEQAAGRKDLTVAIDVYSLGVLLYERLTGRTPFTGETVLEVLRQVRETNPPRPSSITPGLSRDLETICLKCLEKEPGKRYDPTDALADDLDRWLNGEPIVARPVGQAERLWRWCRRNPGVAGLSGAVAASLLGGIGVSSWFAIEAREQTKAERQARERAEKAEEGLERVLVASWLRPLNPEYGANLSEPEFLALWELTETANDQLRFLFLKEAARDPLSAIQLRSRGEHATIAAVGLHPKRREQAERLLAEALRDSTKSLSHRTELALMLIELADKGSPVQRMCMDVIGQGMRDGESDYHDAWLDVFLAKSRRLEPVRAAKLLLATAESGVKTTEVAFALKSLTQDVTHAEGVELCTDACQVFHRMLVQEKYVAVQHHLGLAMAMMARGADSVRATPLIEQALSKPLGSGSRTELLITLASIKARSAPAEAARLLHQEIEKNQVGHETWLMSKELASLATRIETADTQQMCSATCATLDKRLAQNLEYWTIRAVREVVGGTERAERERLCEAVYIRISKALLAQTPFESPQAFQALAELSVHLEPTAASKLLLRTIEQVASSDHRVELAVALAVAAGRLQPDEAARACGQVAPILHRAILEAEYDGGRVEPAKALAAVAERMKPDDAARVCKAAGEFLHQRLVQERDASSRDSSARALAAVATRMHQADASAMLVSASRTLADALAKERSLEASEYLEDALSRLLPHLDSEVAAQPVRLVASRITGDRTPGTRSGYTVNRGPTLDTVITIGSPVNSRPRAEALASAVGVATAGPFASFPFAVAGAEPLPCRLNTQELVELLKLPTCVGELRKVILKHLGNRYRQRFDSHWDFVRYAEEQKLGLDFTTPPKRPGTSR